ncbi:MAG: hypothetical protein K9W43_05340 [Candidatus Thorarchaeota archaeon]|nr:hypothetical protein [Candidatus Thorarchaeota archaeon]
MINLPENTSDLVREFAPILHFHPREGTHCCFPSDAEEIYEQFHEDWSAFKRDLWPNVLDPSAPCYYETFEYSDWIQIRYWFWYRYNKFPYALPCKGLHLGDWEHIEVRIYPTLFDGVIIWLLSNHLTARLGSFPAGYTLPGFIPEDIVLDNYHVHAWVALGSHAHYPNPRSKPLSFLKIWRDLFEDGGVVWRTEDSLRPLKDTNFYEYTGRWGDKKAPRSPTNSYNGPWRSAPNVPPQRYVPDKH